MVINMIEQINLNHEEFASALTPTEALIIKNVASEYELGEIYCPDNHFYYPLTAEECWCVYLEQELNDMV